MMQYLELQSNAGDQPTHPGVLYAEQPRKGETVEAENVLVPYEALEVLEDYDAETVAVNHYDLTSLPVDAYEDLMSRLVRYGQ